MLKLMGFIIAFFMAASLAKAATLEKAQAAYESGAYEEAAQLYLQYVEASEPNASVFHNLGLAFDREKKLGPAVAAYLRATQLQPRQGDFQYNLQFLLGRAADKLDTSFPLSPLERVLLGRYTSEREIYYGFLAVMIVTALCAAYGILGSRYKKAALTGAGISAVFLLYLGISLNAKINSSQDLGAISVAKAEAYSGPTQSIVIFELHEGAPFQIIDTSGDWVKIELSDQKKGWVKRSAITSFGQRSIILPENVSSKS